MKRSLGARTLVYPTPVFVIGSYDDAGKPNVMTAAWAGVCCSTPPSIAVSLRKATYTYGNLVKRRAFTVNVPSVDLIKETDYFGLTSGKDEDKFKATNLHPVRSEIVDAPYVKEFPMVLECEVIHILEIGLHTLFVGEIKDVKVDEKLLDESGDCCIEKVRPFTYAPDDRSYYEVGGKIARAFDAGKKIKRAPK